MNITLTGVAETITAFGGVVTGIGTLALQIMAARRSIQNGRKIDANTEITKATAAKIDDVHAVQVATSGTYPTIKEQP